MLEVKKGTNKPPSPFKFNASWIFDPELCDPLKSSWVHLNSQEGTKAGVLFMENLKKLKKVTLQWEKAKKEREDVELVEIEEWLNVNFSRYVPGFLSEDSKTQLVLKEKCHKEILKEREELWHLKSRVIWFASRDENTKLFHAYAKGRKAHNTIWELQDDRGNMASSFEDLSSMGINHFKSLFKAHPSSSIAEIIRMEGLCPQFVD